MTSRELLKIINDFINAKGISRTTFGKKVLRDPSFYHQLVDGRQVRLDTAHKILRYIERNS